MTDDQTATPNVAPPDDQTYTFDWHQLDTFGDSDGEFLKWMVINLVTRTTEEVEASADRRDLLERLRDASDGFTNVTLSIHANGIELNVPYFVQSLRINMDHWARREAARRLGEVTDFAELQETAESFRRAMVNRARRVADALGVELDEEDRW